MRKSWPWEGSNRATHQIRSSLVSLERLNPPTSETLSDSWIYSFSAPPSPASHARWSGREAIGTLENGHQITRKGRSENDFLSSDPKADLQKCWLQISMKYPGQGGAPLCKLSSFMTSISRTGGREITIYYSWGKKKTTNIPQRPHPAGPGNIQK